MLNPGSHVYVSAPMSGKFMHNFPTFAIVTEALRERGYRVTSPHERDEEKGISPDDELSQEDYAAVLADDIQAIREVDALVVLHGWQESYGARTEVAYARAIGIPVLSYPDLEPVFDKSSEVRITDPNTGGQKGRKPQRFELVPWGSVASIAEVYAHGATKYEDRNWEKGYAWGLSFGALQRHLAAFWQGENDDPESGLPHLAHAGFHILGLLHFGSQDRYAEHDDRP